MKKILKEEEKNLINYIKNNTDECLKIGITKIAELNYTSASKIIRLSKKLGYTGYTDMIYAFKNRIEKNTNLKINNDTKYSIRNKKEINLFINCLIEKKIAIFGEDFSGIIGKYINNRLFSLGIESQFLDCVDSQLFFEGIGKNYDAIILISNTGESVKCLDIIEKSKASKKKYIIISFTGKNKNTICENSDVSFNIEGISTEDIIVKYPTPFYGNVILGFEDLLMLYLDKKREKSKLKY